VWASVQPPRRHGGVGTSWVSLGISTAIFRIFVDAIARDGGATDPSEQSDPQCTRAMDGAICTAPDQKRYWSRSDTGAALNSSALVASTLSKCRPVQTAGPSTSTCFAPTFSNVGPRVVEGCGSNIQDCDMGFSVSPEFRAISCFLDHITAGDPWVAES
jgi:hypothetical protein